MTDLAYMMWIWTIVAVVLFVLLVLWVMVPVLLLIVNRNLRRIVRAQERTNTLLDARLPDLRAPLRRE